MLRSHALLHCNPEGCRTKSLRGAWQTPTPRTSRGINRAEPTSSSFPKAPKGYRRTTSARQVVTGHLHLGAIQPPCILKLRSGRYDIVNLLTTHLRRCGPEDPHRSSLSRVQRVSLVLCLFWEQHKSAGRVAAVVRPL